MNRKEFIQASGIAFFGSMIDPIIMRGQTSPIPIKEINMKKVPQTLLTGLDIGESPRWHEDRLWFCNWMSQEIVTVNMKGKMEVILHLPFPSFPFSIDWLPDGTLIIVSNSDQPLLRMKPDGSLTPHADLSALNIQRWNEIVIDGKGNSYINGGDSIVLITANGSVQKLVDGLAWPNGMIITQDNLKLVVAESFANRLTCFDIATDGSLINRRIWADLKEGVPDGISLDADGNIWYADVPNKCCVLVKEGGEIIEKIELDRGGFACALGGKTRRTLFILSAQWHGFEKINDSKGTGQVQTVRVSSRGAGYP